MTGDGTPQDALPHGTAAPARRPVTSPRVALGAFVLTALGVVGLVTLAASWLVVGVRTMRAAESVDASACVVAYGEGASDADVHYTALPPRGICTWTVDGRSQDVVVAQVPAVVTAGACVAVLAGAAGVALWVVTQRQR
ncbi:hypothetical protein ACTHAM_001620 [Cellulomonas soli]|uniref:hypothetical protein n=1 Tax=Cellulomonas soli TaxID=931535 RepID=UPI003F84D1B7